jgi:hypothetical protein
MLTVLRWFSDSDYPFGFFKLFFVTHVLQDILNTLNVILVKILIETCIFYIVVIRNDTNSQISVNRGGEWNDICYTDDVILANYLCNITGYG